MVVCDLPKVETRVRFPLLAPHLNTKPALKAGFVLNTETQSIFLLRLKSGF